MSQSASDLLKETYEALPYPALPWPGTHPDHLAALARLHGVTTGLPSESRILELVCSDAGNLIPLALSWPDCEAVGVDLAPNQIELGRQCAGELGLGNLRLVAADLSELVGPAGDEALGGKFDFIIAHGLISWVPPEVQHSILRICRERLKPSGVACISYNCYPGWKLRSVLRDALLQRVEGITSYPARIAAASEWLAFLGAEVPDSDGVYAMLLRETAERVLGSPRETAYLAHEYLEPENHPFYFRDFIEAARGVGLRYVADADPASCALVNLPPDTAAGLAPPGTDPIEAQQRLDFLRNRYFRETILCHEEVETLDEPDPAAIEALRLASPMRCEVDESALRRPDFVPFAAPDGRGASFAHPAFKEALARLGAVWPYALPFTEVVPPEVTGDDRRTVQEMVLRCVLADLIELRVDVPPFTGEVSKRPEASPLARWQATDGPLLTTLRHDIVAVEEPAELAFMATLDGQRSLEEIAAAHPGIELDRVLEYMRQHALLIA